MKSTNVMLCFLILLLLAGCGTTNCPECEPTPPSWEACMEQFKNELDGFAAKNDKKLDWPYIIIEDEIMLGSASLIEKPFDLETMPTGDGKQIGVVSIKPKTQNSDLKEGVYAVMLSPDPELKNYARLTLEDANGGTVKMPSPVETILGANLVGINEIAPNDGPCNVKMSCVTQAAKIQQEIRDLANSKCKIIQVHTRCQVIYNKSYCFWVTRIERVHPDDQAKCPPPPGGYPMDTYPLWYFGR